MFDDWSLKKNYRFSHIFFQVSALVCFLLSPAAGNITGDSVKCDGAQSLYSQTLFEVPGNHLLLFIRMRQGGEMVQWWVLGVKERGCSNVY